MTTPRTPRWITLGRLALSAMLILLSACGGRHGGASPNGSGAQVLRVASQRGATRALMEASGVLKGAAYKVEWSEFAAASPLLEALGANAVDVGGVGDAPFVFAYAAGAPIKAVLAYDSGARGTSTALVAAAASPVRTVADLKGRKVATVKGSIGHFLLLKLLEKAGLGSKDVQVVFLDPGAARGALSSGSIDAWATWSPYIGLVTLHDNARIVADGQGVLDGVGFFAASDKAIADKSPILSDFLVRLTRAQAWAAGHQDAYGAVLAKDTGLPLDVARDAARRLAGQAEPIDANLIRKEYATLETFRRAGVIEATPKIDGAFAPRLSQAALAAAGPVGR